MSIYTYQTKPMQSAYFRFFSNAIMTTIIPAPAPKMTIATVKISPPGGGGLGVVDDVVVVRAVTTTITVSVAVLPPTSVTTIV